MYSYRAFIIAVSFARWQHLTSTTVQAATDLLAFSISVPFLWASLMAQMINNLPAMWETWVQSLGQEDPLEKEMATHCSILAWEIPWTEEPGGLQPMELQRVGHN